MVNKCESRAHAGTSEREESAPYSHFVTIPARRLCASSPCAEKTRLRSAPADREAVRRTYLRGSTQDVGALYMDTFGGSLSKSTVSRVIQELTQDLKRGGAKI